MMGGCPFQAGDVVVCVDGSPPTHPYFVKRQHSFPFRVGQILRVRAVKLSESRHAGIVFHDHFEGRYDRTGTEIVFNPIRFRHLPKADEQFARQMRACRPTHDRVAA